MSNHVDRPAPQPAAEPINLQLALYLFSVGHTLTTKEVFYG